MAWTVPQTRLPRELITVVAYNDEVINNLLHLSTHAHTSATGDGGLLPENLTGSSNYFVPTPNGGLMATTGSAEAISTANQVRACRFFLPFSFTLVSLTFSIVATAAGTVGAGIYNNAGTTLLASGTDSSASNNEKQIIISPSVFLKQDFYLLAWTCTSAVPTARGMAAVSRANALINQTDAQYGTCANASAAGVLPATTGVLTGSNIPMIVIKMEGG